MPSLPNMRLEGESDSIRHGIRRYPVAVSSGGEEEGTTQGSAASTWVLTLTWRNHFTKVRDVEHSLELHS